jgi:prepilin-type N-terminal cleavage/methylation domain-containing protein
MSRNQNWSAPVLGRSNVRTAATIEVFQSPEPVQPYRGRDGRAPNNGGFTLVEMLVVIVIVSIMSVAIVAEMHGTFQEALLRSTSRELAGACNLASSRAISINRPHRIRLDRLAHRYFLEKSRRGGTDFYPATDTPGSSGTLDPRIAINILQPGVNSPDDAGQEPSGNAGGQGEFSSNPSEESLTFYPDGTADARQIELADRDGYRLALRINPVTSRVQITAVEHP